MLGGLRLLISMLVVQFFLAGLQILAKIALGSGTFVFALLTYRHIVATLCVAPLAFLWERESFRNLQFSIVMWLFFLALSGIPIALGFYFYGLRDTSPTYALNFFSLVPITTFVISITFRIEKLKLNTKPGKVKLFAAMICLAGGLTVVLYKGHSFHLAHAKAKLPMTIHGKPNWKRGTIFLACCLLGYSFWYITQAKVMKIFPYKYSVTTIASLMGAIQSTVVGLCFDRTKASWKLGWDMELLTVFYSGVFSSALTFVLISRTIEKAGPTYPAMFNPLSLVLVAIIEVIFMGQSISVGSIVGMSMIIIGLYLFIWGKTMEIKRQEEEEEEEEREEEVVEEG